LNSHSSSAAPEQELWLDDLRVYARCPLEWFWEKRAGIPRPRTIASLLPEALKMALAFYYKSYADSVGQAVGQVWRDWCEAWGDVTVADELAEYARGRSRILDLFEKGYLTPPGGGRYKVPQMTNAYRERMHRAGLTRLGHRLDDFARTRGLQLPTADGDYPGSYLGDVFADCLAAAANASRNEKLPLPDRAVVLGWQVPYRVDLGPGLRLMGRADLVIQAPPEPGKEAVIVEIHGYRPMPGLRMGIAARDLRVIAASLAQPCERSLGPEEHPLSWHHVSRVIYRYWATGEAFEFRETNAGYLRAIASAVVRGMTGQVIVPRALTGYDNCRDCAYHAQCWEAGWETLPLVDPGTLGLAEQLRDVARQVRDALRVGSDGHDAQRALEALDLMGAAITRLLPDTVVATALIGEVRHHLEMIQHEAQ
jgi:hypothetical protein